MHKQSIHPSIKQYLISEGDGRRELELQVGGVHAVQKPKHCAPCHVLQIEHTLSLRAITDMSMGSR